MVNQGYLPDAIINYIAFLGWCPDSNREIFSLEELVKEFSPERISKSPAIFDYKKLDWFNSEYIKLKSAEEFASISEQYIKKVAPSRDFKKISLILQNRISRLSEISESIEFLEVLPEYDVSLFENKKSKTNLCISEKILKEMKPDLEKLNPWNYEKIHDYLINFAKRHDIKNGTAMWPLRIAVSGKAVTPGGAVEILDILGREESIKRIEKALKKF